MIPQASPGPPLPVTGRLSSRQPCPTGLAALPLVQVVVELRALVVADDATGHEVVRFRSDLELVDLEMAVESTETANGPGHTVRPRQAEPLHDAIGGGPRVVREEHGLRSGAAS